MTKQTQLNNKYLTAQLVLLIFIAFSTIQCVLLALSVNITLLFSASIIMLFENVFDSGIKYVVQTLYLALMFSSLFLSSRTRGVWWLAVSSTVITFDLIYCILSWLKDGHELVYVIYLVLEATICVYMIVGVVAGFKLHTILEKTKISERTLIAND